MIWILILRKDLNCHLLILHDEVLTSRLSNSISNYSHLNLTIFFTISTFTSQYEIKHRVTFQNNSAKINFGPYEQKVFEAGSTSLVQILG